MGYVLRDLAARKYLPTRYAKDILDDALELAQRLRILDELGQVTGILESVDEGGAARADSRLPPYQPG